MTKKPITDGAKTERFNLFWSLAESEAIDDWSFNNRIRSKSDAVRRLVQIGIAADKAMNGLPRQIFNHIQSRDALPDTVDKALEQDCPPEMRKFIEDVLRVEMRNWLRQDEIFTVVLGLAFSIPALVGNVEMDDAAHETSELMKAVDETLIRIRQQLDDLEIDDDSKKGQKP